ncbi:MAG TPA: cell division regulator GpsB [Bacillota bacterium]|nr:cell division regulator GpsB [Bacillota bacterium]
MDQNQIQLSGTDILEKDFKTAMRGYHQAEVDEFLDVIIQDYEIFQKEINRLSEENDRLKRQSGTQARSRAAAAPNHQVNYDLLKRLSNLEKAVFGKKYADTES